MSNSTRNQQTSTVLIAAEASALFALANNFALRHHDSNQKASYDKEICYSWMFYFYLATYHATIRFLIKEQQGHGAPAPSF